MARGPAGAGGTLINGALIPIVAQAVARVTCLVIAWMSRRKRNLGVASCPPGFNSLKNAFFVRYQGEDEAEILVEDMVWVDRVVTKEEEESGEFRRESSNMYLSISSKNSSIHS